MKKRILKKASRYVFGFGGRKMASSRLAKRRLALSNAKFWTKRRKK